MGYDGTRKSQKDQETLMLLSTKYKKKSNCYVTEDTVGKPSVVNSTQDHHHQTNIYNCEQQYTSQRYKLPDEAACKGQDG